MKGIVVIVKDISGLLRSAPDSSRQLRTAPDTSAPVYMWSQCLRDILSPEPSGIANTDGGQAQHETNKKSNEYKYGQALANMYL